MRKFKLLNGKHSQRDKDGVLKRYYAKDGHVVEVEDNVDLMEQFSGRFEEVGRPGRMQEGSPPDTIPNIDRRKVFSATEALPATPPLPDGEVRAQAADKKRKAAIREEVAAHPEILESEETEEEDVEPGEEREAVKSKLGEDVTDDFDGVADQDLAVIKAEEGNNYYVVDPAKPNKALNKEGEDDLTSKKMVKKFIKEFTESK